MSLLDLCPGGALLEPKRPVERAIDPDAADALRAKILADCLPAQREFLDDEDHRILSYIGGFGSGKSFALAAKLIFLGLRNPGGTLMACEPTFPMIRTVLVPAIDMALEQWDIEYSSGQPTAGILDQPAHGAGHHLLPISRKLSAHQGPEHLCSGLG